MKNNNLEEQKPVVEPVELKNVTPDDLGITQPKQNEKDTKIFASQDEKKVDKKEKDPFEFCSEAPENEVEINF